MAERKSSLSDYGRNVANRLRQSFSRSQQNPVPNLYEGNNTPQRPKRASLGGVSYGAPPSNNNQLEHPGESHDHSFQNHGYARSQDNVNGGRNKKRPYYIKNDAADQRRSSSQADLSTPGALPHSSAPLYPSLSDINSTPPAYSAPPAVSRVARPGLHPSQSDVRSSRSSIHSMVSNITNISVISAPCGVLRVSRPDLRPSLSDVSRLSEVR